VVTIPLNPDSAAPAFRVSAPAAVESVPVPESVPFEVTLCAIVGFAPSGSEQALPTVFVPVLVKVTRLKLILLQAKLDELPAKLTVPELCVNVPPVTVNAAEKVVVPDDATNVPVLANVNVLVTDKAWLLAVNVPDDTVSAPPTASDLDWLIVPV
jgi:hypothetical protein